MLLGALTAALHLEAGALKLQGFVEGGTGPGAAGQGGGQQQGGGGELGEEAHQEETRWGDGTFPSMGPSTAFNEGWMV